MVPTKATVSNVKAIACGDRYTMFLLNDGTVYGCGENNSGELGIGNTTNPIITRTKANISNAKDIACGEYYTMFLLNDGTIFGCGENDYAQLGIGINNNPITTPTKSSIDLTDVCKIACGQYHTIVLLKDGTVYGCGANMNGGQLGIGAVYTFTKKFTKLSLSNVKAIACGQYYTIFALNDGTVYGCIHKC